MAQNQLTTIEKREVPKPGYDEINRARHLASRLRRLIDITPKDVRVSVSREEAEELCQLLHDSLRTIDLLESQNDG